MKTTIKRYLLQALAGAGFLLLPLASAQAQSGDFCSYGPIRSLPAEGGWGDESRCDCGSGNIQGGVFASDNTFAWLWSAGPSTGEVWVLLEMEHPTRGNVGFRFVNAASGGAYFVNGGSGRNDPMQTTTRFTWTGRYRTVCFQ